MGEEPLGMGAQVVAGITDNMWNKATSCIRKLRLRRGRKRKLKIVYNMTKAKLSYILALRWRL
ncbi:hypothetical protein H5410_002384 [Solanum commersonii]|uniref:Uncharacterized protein n=1 Tax=Solanum commersonii TaxID=4109 RepID=A0A9J6B258_SOLCO|nr:hypothetical protein H5410_002384 [Solanum commersonii]